MNDEINKYVKLGIFRNKIKTSTLPSVCLYSLSKKCVVDNYYDKFEIIDNTLENTCVEISLLHHEIIDINIDKINNSEGIIITKSDSDIYKYRFGYIPTEKSFQS